MIITNENWVREIYIDVDTHQLIKEKMKAITLNPYRDWAETQKIAANILYSLLPYKIYKILKNFATEKTGESAILIKNLPTTFSILPPTPKSDIMRNGKDFLSEQILLGLGSLLGLKINILLEEKDGAPIQQVIPLEGKEYSESGVGSKVDFSIHVENASYKKMTRFFMLFCLKMKEDAFTTIYPCSEIVDRLSIKVIEELKKPNFLHKSGPSFRKALSHKGSILTEKNDCFKIRINTATDRCVALNKEGENALNTVKGVLNDSLSIKNICLTPGDLLFVNNTMACHGRTSFEMGENPDIRRWLQRIYFT